MVVTSIFLFVQIMTLPYRRNGSLNYSMFTDCSILENNILTEVLCLPHANISKTFVFDCVVKTVSNVRSRSIPSESMRENTARKMK